MESLIETLKLQDFIYLGVVIATFLFLALLVSRQIWVIAEIAFAVMFGIGFFAFPSYILAFQMTAEPDDKEILLARVYGVVFLAAGFTWFRTRETRDATVPITLMTSRVVTSSILLMAQLVSYVAATVKRPSAISSSSNKTVEESVPVWSRETFLVYFVAPTALWMVASLIHLLRSHDFNFYPQHNIRLNNHLRIDAWLMLLFGVAFLSFPQQIIRAEFSTSPSSVALHIVRSIGAIMVGEAVVSLQAPGFLHPRDKQTLFATRIVMILLKAAVLAAGCFWFTLIDVNCFLYTVALHVPLLANSVVGLLSDGTKIYTVSTPKKRDSKND